MTWDSPFNYWNYFEISSSYTYAFCLIQVSSTREGCMEVFCSREQCLIDPEVLSELEAGKREALWTHIYLHIYESLSNCRYSGLLETQRVGRVLSFFSSRRNWDSPNPSPAGECAPPPPWFWGEGHTRWRQRGWESPNSHEGTCTGTLYILYTYFVLKPVWWSLPLGSEKRNHRPSSKTNNLIFYKRLFWQTKDFSALNCSKAVIEPDPDVGGGGGVEALRPFVELSSKYCTWR